MGVPEPVSTSNESGSLGGEPGASVGPEKGGPGFKRWLTTGLIAGLAAGLVSWGAGELAYGAYRTPLSKVSVGPITMMQATTPSTNLSDAKNANLAFAILGAVLGTSLGIAGGVLRRSSRRAALAGLAGLVVGGLAGALTPQALLALHYRRFVPDPNDIAMPLLTLGGIWSTAGAAGGLAFGFGSIGGRRVGRATLFALLGALLGTVAYVVVGVLLFTDANPTDPLAKSWTARLLARVLVCVLAGAGAAAGAWDFGRARAGVSDAP